VWANAARSVLLDFDDYLFAGHTGHSAVLVSLAAGELLDASGAALLAATVVANEAGGRLGAAMLTGPHNGQMWAYIHNIGGAVAAGRLLGLDATRMRDAIGLALTQPPYPLPATFMGSDGKALTASGPAVEGMRAAFLAAEGLRCEVDVLSDRNGFFARIHPGALAGMFSGFGDAWVTDSLSYKVYPGCAYLDTAADAALTLVGREGITATDVARGTIRAGLLTMGMEEMSGWYRGAGGHLRDINLNFSAAYSVAIALLAGRLTAAEFDPVWWQPRASEIEDLAKRIAVVFDGAMTAGMAQTHGFDLMGIIGKAADAPVLDGVSFVDYQSRFPATVELELRDGRMVVETVDIPLGGAGRPAEETRGLVRAKLEESGAPPDLFPALEGLANLGAAADIRRLLAG
jgi:2-methylcitrate dehydratase PrpD